MLTERLTMVRVFEELQGLGYRGGYDAVRQRALTWQPRMLAASFILFVVPAATVPTYPEPEAALDQLCMNQKGGRLVLPQEISIRMISIAFTLSRCINGTAASKAALFPLKAASSAMSRPS